MNISVGIKAEREKEIFYDNLMNKVNVSEDDYFQMIRSKKNCQKYAHIQYNHKSGMNYLCLDCDNDVFQTLEDKNLYPNLVALNKDNNKGHMFFRLNSFVGTTSNSRMKPQRTARLLTHALNNYLNCDKQFTGVQSKNPLNTDKYRVYSYSNDGYDFNDLFDNIPDEFIYINEPGRIIVDKKELLIVKVGERNSYLFDETRTEAYKLKNKINNYNDLHAEIERIYLSFNASIQEPLSLSEAKHSIKSITNYVFYKYTGDKKNRGIMNLAAYGHDLTLQDKQVAGANHTAKIKREATEQRIIDAIKGLQAESVKVTQKAISERSGLHRNSLRNYSELIKKLK
ncbi:replication initiation protein [Photobacterium damselae subsp. damselae]|uniref:Replication initiation protein n=1 Tax=Photobacterium damselae subsp. damselae TaxID=85581 RepID=A0A850R7R5_PHODD|nr:replication initiation protein [Photobacterium damselae subsp. damselae]